MFKAPNLRAYKWFFVGVTLVLVTLVSGVFANDAENEPDETLTSGQKSQIANIINKGLGSESGKAVTADEIEVDDGLPVNLKLAGVQKQKRPKVGHKDKTFDAIAFVERHVSLINGRAKFQSALIVRDYSGAQVEESRYSFQLDKKFPEYLFNPILSSNQNHVFFQYGANYNGSEYSPAAYGLYVLFRKTGDVVKVDSEYLSSVYTPTSSDGRFIAYMARHRGKEQIRVFDAIKRTSVIVASAASLYADYSWKPGASPVLCYSKLQKTKGKTALQQNVSFLFNPLTASHQQYKSNSSFVQFFGRDKFVLYTDSADSAVRMQILQGKKAKKNTILKERIDYFDKMHFNEASHKFALPMRKRASKSGMLEIGFTLLDTSLHKTTSRKYLLKSDSDYTMVNILAWDKSGQHAYLGVEQGKALSHTDGTQSSEFSVVKYDIQKKSWALIERFADACGLSGNISGSTFRISYNGE